MSGYLVGKFMQILDFVSFVNLCMFHVSEEQKETERDIWDRMQGLLTLFEFFEFL